MSIASLVKPGGYIIIGLYSKIGRIRMDFRRFLNKIFGESILQLDPYLRRDLSSAKRGAWIMDQYYNPHETKHSMSEVIKWFSDVRIFFCLICNLFV